MKKVGRPRVNISCSVPGCTHPGYCKQLCKMHYNRVWRRGDVHAGEFRQRFDASFQRAEGNVCWIWTGLLQKSGYGVIKRKQKAVRAHRAAYELYVGPIPTGLHVLHRCDNPPCVNPQHLFLGTHVDNMRDMEKKGRAKWIQENLRSRP